MRALITTTPGPVDEKKIEALSAEIVAAFDRYLDRYPSRNRRSKYASMGPVARILDLVRIKGASAEHILGVAIRMHEMNPIASRYVSPEAIAELETGTKKLLELVQIAPSSRLARVLGRLDYSVYYLRRKKGIEWRQHIASAFGAFAQERSALFKEGVFPARRGRAWESMNEQQREIVEAFWTERPDLEAVEADVDEDQEESR